MSRPHATRTIVLYVSLFVSLILLAIIWQINTYVAGLPPLLDIPNYQVDRVLLTDQTDGAKINPELLIPACGGQDCLRSLDQPRFTSATGAPSWLQDDDRVIGILFDGVVRAYPEKILSHHIVVNDVINLKPLIITYSPLTRSAEAYQPIVNGIQTQFGVSGLVYQSDMVLYDRLQGNLWQQLTGQAILGPAAQADEVLPSLPMSFTTWKIWRDAHPETQILSATTGYPFDYSQLLYSDYHASDELRFKTTFTNTLLPAKTLIYGLTIGSMSKAYPDNLLSQTPLTDRLATTTLTLRREVDGSVVATNTKTSEQIYLRPAYWFAWTALYPASSVYRQR